jgi:PAS domain S-box-containing protein
VERVKAITRYGYVLKNSGEFILTESITMAYELFEAHRSLEQSNANWRNTFDAIGEMVMIISTDHTIMQINRAGCDALGLEAKAIVGNKCFQLVHGTDYPITACPCTTALETGRPSRSEHEENGRVYELIAWPVRSQGSGVVESFVHVVADITDRKRYEGMLNRRGEGALENPG